MAMLSTAFRAQPFAANAEANRKRVIPPMPDTASDDEYREKPSS
jgi:hypothetical protein